MHTGQYLAVLLDYAKPLHQNELEFRVQPTVVSRQKLGPGVPIARAPLRYEWTDWQSIIGVFPSGLWH